MHHHRRFRATVGALDRQDPVHTPHDRLFRHVFSDRVQAAGELRSMLPTELSRRIDWRTLRTVPGTFVDETLTERRSDLLFTARLGDGEILLYLLLEHQSTADELMPLGLLRYMVRIWDEYLLAHPGVKRLPLIVPLVVHHSQRGWRAAALRVAHRRPVGGARRGAAPARAGARPGAAVAALLQMVKPGGRRGGRAASLSESGTRGCPCPKRRGCARQRGTRAAHFDASPSVGFRPEGALLRSDDVDARRYFFGSRSS